MANCDRLSLFANQAKSTAFIDFDRDKDNKPKCYSDDKACSLTCAPALAATLTPTPTPAGSTALTPPSLLTRPSTLASARPQLARVTQRGKSSSRAAAESASKAELKSETTPGKLIDI